MQKTPVLALLLTLLASDHAWSQVNDGPLSFTSGKQRTALIELYTSEGCSSCPPADRWLGKLKNDAGLWADFIPVAFHVDYWDYIGWQDRFARAEYSDRQRRFAAQGNARFVYTPGFFRNGQEWRGWQSRKSLQADKAQVGVLSLTVNAGDISVAFAAQGDKLPDLIAHIAALGMDLETKVRAGENDGKTLRHNFVALDVTAIPMKRSGNGFTATTPAMTLQQPYQALIAWVSEKGSQTPVQSVGGYLPKD